MPLFRTEAIIMGGWDLGEADRILSFCTRRMGNIRAVATGARRVRSKYGGRIQLFTHGLLVGFFKENRDLFQINEFEPLDSFQGLRSNLNLLTHASYLVELSSLLTFQAEGSEEVFLLLLRALRRLEAGSDPFHAGKVFEAGLLQSAGYPPQFRRCIRCKISPLGGAEVFFSPGEGGILCFDCRTRSDPSFLLTSGSLAYLLEAQRGDFRRLSTVPLSNQERILIEKAMRAYIGHILPRSLRTLDFMKQMRIDPSCTGGSAPLST